MEPKSLFPSWSFAVNEDRTLPVIQQRAHERVWNELYWMNENSSVPKIVGETGLTATGNSLFTDIMAEGIGGNLTNQLDYAAFTLNATCSCGGSGYSWWQYQDGYWFASNGGTRFFGLLERGFDPSTAAEKPAVNAVFRPFVPPLVGTTGPCPLNYSPTYSQALVYYDPYRTSDYNTSGTNAVSGYVTDDNNDPIQDAVVLAGNYIQFNSITNKHEYNWLYSLSDENGYFTVVPYNYIDFSETKINGIKVSFLASKKEEFGAFQNTQMPALTQPVVLEQKPFHYDEIVSNSVVSIGENKNYKGWNSIKFLNANTIDGNGISGGIVEIAARNKIKLAHGFTAKKGSDVHIYCTNTFSVCVEYQGYRPLAELENSNYLAFNSNKNMEIQFAMPEITVELFPNPNTGVFTIIFSKPVEKQPVILSITNVLGVMVKNLTFYKPPFIVNAQTLSKGIYFVQIKSSSFNLLKTLVIN